MPRLILMDAAGHARQFVLKAQSNTLGRARNNDVVIDSLRASRAHAVIVVEGTQATLMDLHSLNGTLVNGTLVGQHALAHGDSIQIGSIEMRFVGIEKELSEEEALRLLTAPTLMVELDGNDVLSTLHDPMQERRRERAWP